MSTFRKVVHRKPVPFRPHEHVPDYLLVYIIETLECGHQIHTFPTADPLIAVRRNCTECDECKPKKKPSASVTEVRAENAA